MNTPNYPHPNEVIGFNNKQLAEFCADYERTKRKLAEWEAVSEMGPAWARSALVEMAHEREWLDHYEAALHRIRDGMADDRAYRGAARDALDGKDMGASPIRRASIRRSLAAAPDMLAALKEAEQELEANKTAMLGPEWAAQRTATGGALLTVSRAIMKAEGKP
jgi:hypothetical protein